MSEATLPGLETVEPVLPMSERTPWIERGPQKRLMLFSGRSNPELAEQWRGMIPAGRMGEPRDLDGLVVFLCSDASSYVMGQSILIDGAYTAV